GGGHFDDTAAEGLPEVLDFRGRGRICFRGGRDDGDAATKEVGGGRFCAILFATGNGVAAEEWLLEFGGLDGGDNLGFGAAGVGKDAVGWAMLRRLLDEVGDGIDGGTNDDKIGLANAGGDVGGDLGDAAASKGCFQRRFAAADAGDLDGAVARAQGEANGAADEAGADDGDVAEGGHGEFSVLTGEF